jgi:hypothetical protein
MSKYLTIHEEAGSHIHVLYDFVTAPIEFPFIRGKFYFLFYQCPPKYKVIYAVDQRAVSENFSCTQNSVARPLARMHSPVNIYLYFHLYFRHSCYSAVLWIRIHRIRKLWVSLIRIRNHFLFVWILPSASKKSKKTLISTAL